MNKVLIFNDLMINRRKFRYLENPTWLDDADYNKTLISNKVSFGKEGY